MADSDHENSYAQEDRLAADQERLNLLGQIQDLCTAQETLAEERDQVAASNRQLCAEQGKLAEQGRLDLEFQKCEAEHTAELDAQVVASLEERTTGVEAELREDAPDAVVALNQARTR